MKINAAKTAAANLIDLVNASNAGLNLTAGQVTIAAPTVKADSGDGRNTSVVLTSVGGQGYSGNVTVNYTRRPLNDSVAAPDPTLTQTVGADADAVVTAIATKLGLVAAELKLVDQANGNADVTGAISNSPATLTLAVKGTSLLYAPGATQLITFTWNEPPLNGAVTTTNLTGFDAAS